MNNISLLNSHHNNLTVFFDFISLMKQYYDYNYCMGEASFFLFIGIEVLKLCEP